MMKLLQQWKIIKVYSILQPCLHVIKNKGIDHTVVMVFHANPFGTVRGKPIERITVKLKFLHQWRIPIIEKSEPNLTSLLQPSKDRLRYQPFSKRIKNIRVHLKRTPLKWRRHSSKISMCPPIVFGQRSRAWSSSKPTIWRQDSISSTASWSEDMTCTKSLKRPVRRRAWICMHESQITVASTYKSHTNPSFQTTGRPWSQFDGIYAETQPGPKMPRRTCQILLDKSIYTDMNTQTGSLQDWLWSWPLELICANSTWRMNTSNDATGLNYISMYF